MDWDKISRCDHKNLYPDYCATIHCSTPYCTGYEIHCKDCGAFISTCGCGAWDGVSGWPIARHITEARKKRTTSPNSGA